MVKMSPTERKIQAIQDWAQHGRAFSFNGNLRSVGKAEIYSYGTRIVELKQGVLPLQFKVGEAGTHTTTRHINLVKRAFGELETKFPGRYVVV